MIENATRRKLAAGEPVYGCFLRQAEPSLAEFIALIGWDFVIFDGEHGTLEPRDVEGLCRGVEVGGSIPFARVPVNQPHDILRFLDTGIAGVHIPWVNSAEEAAAAVASVKYWPEGRRGLAGSRASRWGMTEPIGKYTERANLETMVVIHIETIEAVDAIEDYVAIDGIDVLFIGPTDLSHSLGHPGDLDHPAVVSAMERVRSSVVRSDKVLGVFAGTPERVVDWRDRGARYFATTAESLLEAGMSGYLDEVRAT
jgi:4-hydroxy-2-oxoheptanedioate aldolase